MNEPKPNPAVTPATPPAAKPAAPAKKPSREALIQQKVNVGLTREQAIAVIEAQEREDAARAKK